MLGKISGIYEFEPKRCENYKYHDFHTSADYSVPAITECTRSIYNINVYSIARIVGNQ